MTQLVSVITYPLDSTIQRLNNRGKEARLGSTGIIII